MSNKLAFHHMLNKAAENYKVNGKEMSKNNNINRKYTKNTFKFFIGWFEFVVSMSSAKKKLGTSFQKQSQTMNYTFYNYIFLN